MHFLLAETRQQLRDPPDMLDLLNHVGAKAPHKCKDIGLQLNLKSVRENWTPSALPTSAVHQTTMQKYLLIGKAK